MDNVIFVGGVPPIELQEKVREWGSPTDFAGYTFQTACLEGLDFHYPNLKVLSSIWITPYPKSKRIFIPKCTFSHRNDGGNQDIMMGVFNLTGLSKISRFCRLCGTLKKELSKKEDNVVILYSLSSFSLWAIKLFRKRISKFCVIVPDLPEYMSTNSSFLFRFAKKVDRKLIMKALLDVDGFVLLSKYMKERLPVGKKPWVVYEGVCRKNDIENVDKENNKVILYTGNASKKFGIDKLLDAFELIKSPDYRLWIRGQGDAVGEIRERMKKDSRISLIGPMPKDDLLRLQKKATILINPTSPSLTFTKYFFPSKTMEYLASGTPTVMFKLPCIPDDYDPFIYYINNDNVHGIFETIVDVCERPVEELSEFGKKASEFILENKNPVKQAEKIVSLIKEIKKE